MKRITIYFLVAVLGILLVLPSVASATGQTHTVQYGETLTSIAVRYGVSVDALVAANRLASPNLIVAGQVLIIPGTAPAPQAAPPASGSSYVVQPGDSLGDIAARYGVSADSL